MYTYTCLNMGYRNCCKDGLSSWARLGTSPRSRPQHSATVIQDGAPQESVQKSLIQWLNSMVYGRYAYSNGVYKPTYNSGGTILYLSSLTAFSIAKPRTVFGAQWLASALELPLQFPCETEFPNWLVEKVFWKVDNFTMVGRSPTWGCTAS